MIGIYLLKKGGVVVYVGQSINIEQRIKQHKDKKFDDYMTIECEKNLLNETEEAYILLFNPKYNIKKAEINTHKKTYIYQSSNKTKMIKVDDKVHEEAKRKAEEKGMTLKGYIKHLVNKDK